MKRVGWLCLVVGVTGCGGAPGPANVQAQDKKETTKGTAVELGDLRSPAPAEWKEEQTTSSMRAYQFRLPHVPGEDEDAELVVFYFGPGGGGSAADNIKRWKGFFTPPEGKTVDDISKVEDLKVAGADVTVLDIHGTYHFKNPPFDPRAKEETRPDYRMLGVVFACDKGPYFLRLVGPAKTVAHYQPGFMDWLKAFK